MSEPQSSVLAVGDRSDAGRSAAQWARRFAGDRGARWLATPPYARSPLVLDMASKQEVQFVVSGLRCGEASTARDVEGELAALMHRAPCPLWMVQPWAA